MRKLTRLVFAPQGRSFLDLCRFGSPTCRQPERLPQSMLRSEYWQGTRAQFVARWAEWHLQPQCRGMELYCSLAIPKRLCLSFIRP